MKYFSYLLVLMSLASTTFFSACSSKTEDPTPTTGTVNGVISPAGSITTVTATSSTNQTTTVTPTAGGSYEFGSLAPGNYTLTFTAASGYATPAPQTVTVTTGNTTTATPVLVSAGSGNSGSGTWTVDGTTRSSAVTAALQSGTLTLVMYDAPSSTTVTTTVANFNGTTTSFSLGSLTTFLVYGILSNGSSQLWSTYATGGSGTITFSSINASTKKISGTITASAPALSGATGTKAITASFTNITYQ